MKRAAPSSSISHARHVDDDAVLEGLASKRIRYYVCDFPARKLQGHPQVVALPHLGASTREAEDNCAVMVVDQVRDFLENGNIVNAVNFPDVVMMREAPYRVGIANANVPNMVGRSQRRWRRRDSTYQHLNTSKGGWPTRWWTWTALCRRRYRQIASIQGVLSFAISGDHKQ